MNTETIEKIVQQGDVADIILVELVSARNECKEQLIKNIEKNNMLYAEVEKTEKEISSVLNQLGKITGYIEQFNIELNNRKPVIEK